MTMTADTSTHPFQIAGLGLAPFRFTGLRDRADQQLAAAQSLGGMPTDHKVGGTCNYCSRAIVAKYYFESSDGKKFYVGSTCVEKANKKVPYRYGSATDSAVRAIKKARNEKETARRHVKQAKQLVEIRAWLSCEKTRAVLASHPHPKEWADTGQTLLDSVEWYMRHAGTTGRCKQHSVIKTALG